jgi:hypothetical protein
LYPPCTYLALATKIILATVHYTHGRIINKSNPYYDKIWIYLQAIHVGHSSEQVELLFEHLGYLFSEWEEYGEEQPVTKYTHTTIGLWKQHCIPPWNNWSIGSFDGYGDRARELPCCLPSQQPQEA